MDRVKDIDPSKKINAAIVYLTQNNDVRRTYLKTSLYFLFRNFNAHHMYPVIIFHEGDYDARSQQDVLLSVRASVRSLVSFVALDKEDFEIPGWVDKDKMKRCIALKPVPYWRTEKYRLMCQWWLRRMPDYCKGYDYIMRLDDDSFIEERIDVDLFAWAAQKNLVLASNMLHIDCGICCFDMKELFESLFPDKKDDLREMFINQTVNLRGVQLHHIRALLSIMKDPLPEQIDMNYPISMPIMYYNNFHITQPRFWLQDDVKATLDAIDRHGGVFYYRWGDAPLQTLIALMHGGKERMDRCIFRYSKRLQREAFHGDDDQFHSYMPDTYDKSSCVTETMVQGNR